MSTSVATRGFSEQSPANGSEKRPGGPTLRTALRVVLVLVGALLALALIATIALVAGSGETSGIETQQAETVPTVRGFELFATEPGLVMNNTASPVNVRVRPGTDADVVGEVPTGDAVLPLATGRSATNGDEIWMEVDVQGTIGWVRADLVVWADAN